MTNPRRAMHRALLLLVLLQASCHWLLPLHPRSMDSSSERADGSGDEGEGGADRTARVCDAAGAASGCCSECRARLERCATVLWPVGPPSADCHTSNGTQCPATGVCAATFFNYGLCGLSKEYDVPPLNGRSLKVAGCSDASPTAPWNLLRFVDYVVEEENTPAQWIQIGEVHDPRLQTEAGCREDSFTPSKPGKIRVRSLGQAGGFYACVFLE